MRAIENSGVRKGWLRNHGLQTPERKAWRTGVGGDSVNTLYFLNYPTTVQPGQVVWFCSYFNLREDCCLSSVYL